MLLIAFLFCILFVQVAKPAFACTTVLAGKDVTETGEVLVGHNEDSSGRYVMRTHLVPEMTRPAETVRFEPGTALLSLPEYRPKLFWAEARPYIADGGASFCDFYANAHGVVICSDNCGKPKEDRPELTEGGIGYGIRRLTAERAKSAYNAVEVATELLEKYGYTGNGRSYHFADKNEIWVLQVVNGKHYAVKRVPDDEIYVNPNHYTIRKPDPNTPGLESLVAYAVERGWHDPARGAFDFAQTYQDADAYRAVRNVHRHRRGLEILLGHPLDSEAELPFSVKPARKIGVEDIKKVLRCHFEDTPQDISDGETPHFMETRPVCAGTTLESYIVQIRENHDMTLIRRALGRPCLTPYSPWYFGASGFPIEYSPNAPEKALETHFAVPAPDLDHTQDEAWFHYTDLQAAIDPLYKKLARKLKDSVAEFERTLEKEIRYFEPVAEEHFKTDPDKARGLLAGSVSDWAARTLRKLDELYSGLGVLKAEAPKTIDVNDSSKTFAIRVALDDLRGFIESADDVALEKTTFSPHYVPLAKRAKTENAAISEGKLCLSFRTGEWVKNSTPCLTDMWLILENKKGGRLVGKALATLTKEAEAAPEAKVPTCDCA